MVVASKSQIEFYISEGRNSYCAGFGGGCHLVTKEEVIGLYNTYPNDQMNTKFEWPANAVYWTSKQQSTGRYCYVHLLNGAVGDGNRSDYGSLCPQLESGKIETRRSSVTAVALTGSLAVRVWTVMITITLKALHF